jgi:alpha-ketoglutarate-dependent taurine dioxygenase
MRLHPTGRFDNHAAEYALIQVRPLAEAAQQAVETRDTPIGRLAATRRSQTLPDELLRKIKGSVHPLVRSHPVTAEKSLYIDPSYAINLDGMLLEESAPIMRSLTDHITQPAFTCRLRWESQVLAIWDSRLCLHQAYNDYHGFRREMYRTTVAGEVPA